MNREQIEKISKALADETRLRIFQAIAAKKDATCGEIVSLHGVTPATVSHHMKMLADAGLIRCRKEGQFVHSCAIPETIEAYSRALKRLTKATTKASRNRN